MVCSIQGRTKFLRQQAIVGLISLLFGGQCADGFSSNARNPWRIHSSSLSDVGTPYRLQLSLNDDWSELANEVIGKGEVAISRGAVGSPSSVKKAAIQSTQHFSFQFPEWNINLPISGGSDLSSAMEYAIKSTESAISEVTTLFMSLPLLGKIGVACLPVAILLLASFYTMVLMVPDDFRNGMEPYRRGNYDPIQAKAYYSRHQILVIQRASHVLRLSNGFLLNYIFDKYILKDEERNRARRAEELLVLVTKLGPTAIKIGQALSVRPDLIPEEYARALSTLQDQVPPFDGRDAKRILKSELGAEKFAHFKDFPFMKANGEPVASASIGQVYQGKIDDLEVAVKVQRPNVLAEIALDLHLVREFAPFYKRITGTATDLQGLADEWGRGFIAELDYRKEADSTMRFTEEMQKRNLNAVIAPRVITDYCTEQALVTEWIDGVRIDRSDAEDIPRLCAVALNAYLVMLLEMQSLHCDPHPGNLLRTKDGKLCILDFGMTLEVDPKLQYSLLEYVAHLTSDDYEKLPEDLAALGFLKEGKLEFVRRSGVLEPLKYFLKQAGQGGGAKGVRERIFVEYREKYPGLSDDALRVEMRSEMKARVNEIAQREGAVTGITVEVEELQRRNRDAFCIPEWFLYTSRAFLTLEGISLQADENFSIIKSCFPYVAKRLLGDDSPRAQKALKELLYGAENHISIKRVADLADGFSSYTTTSKTMNKKFEHDSSGRALVFAEGNSASRESLLSPAERNKRLAQTETTLTLAKDSADILLNPEGSLIQKILLEESVRVTSAQVKDNLRNLLVDGPKRFRDSLPLGVGSFLPPLPFEDQVSVFVGKTEDEIKAQQLAEKLVALVSQPQIERIRQGNEGASIANDKGTEPLAINMLLEDYEPEQLALLSKELRENLPKYGPLLGLLGAKYTSALLQTASDNIDLALISLEKEGNSADGVTKVTARSFSNAARQGANVISNHFAASSSGNVQGSK